MLLLYWWGKATSRGRQSFIYLVYRNLWSALKTDSHDQHCTRVQDPWKNKWAKAGLFLFFSYNILQKNCRPQLDSNSDRRKWMREFWPLDHYNRPTNWATTTAHPLSVLRSIPKGIFLWLNQLPIHYSKRCIHWWWSFIFIIKTVTQAVRLLSHKMSFSRSRWAVWPDG